MNNITKGMLLPSIYQKLYAVSLN